MHVFSSPVHELPSVLAELEAKKAAGGCLKGVCSGHVIFGSKWGGAATLPVCRIGCCCLQGSQKRPLSAKVRFWPKRLLLMHVLSSPVYELPSVLADLEAKKGGVCSSLLECER